MKILNLLKEHFCKEERKIIICKKGRAEFIYYDQNSTATRVLNWIEKKAPKKRDQFFYGKEKGTIGLIKNGKKIILPFGIYIVAIDGEIFIPEKKIVEGFCNVGA